MAVEKKGTLSIHTENIFPIIKKWLYSEHDIFLRELISNAIDAMNKRKAIDSNVKPEDLKIKIKLDKKKKTIQIIDSGIGMTAEEIEKYINQIAFSGAEDFVEKFKDKQTSIIGHFGLGFYSTFMVADKVTIDSLSYQEGATPAFWECDGEIDFEQSAGKKKEIGTTVTIHLSNDNKEYTEESKIKELIEKYSNFMPYSIYLNKEKEAINQHEALWNRKPKDVTDEEYKEFYKKLFHEWEDPLFWIHLNVDYPFNLKGILYFPKFKNNFDMNQGKVKLFCNNVFVADDLKDLIPEFMMLLRGGIDIPDIPLNVSRSFLQHDKEVRKIAQYIIKKIADSLKDIFKSDRKRYEELWKDVSHFVKYGLLTDEKFYESMKDYIIFKTTNDDYVTIQEYRDRNKSDAKPQKVFYSPGENTQVTYLNLMKEQGVEVIFADSVIDNHLFQHMEMKDNEVTFVRIDSELNENLVDSTKAEVADSTNRTPSEKIKEVFEKVLNDEIEASFSKESYGDFIKKFPEAVTILTPYLRQKDDFSYIKPYEIPFDVREKLGTNAFKEILTNLHLNITADVKNLKSQNIPAMIVFNEFMRRFQEMNQMRGEGSDMLQNHNLIVNSENEIIKNILSFEENGEEEKVELLVKYIHDLALIEQKQFSGKELQEFIKNSNQVLQLIK
ncbi:MAG: molecular chaperone HtpG [Candidatus Cloacimonetes bacterium]|nr:molecular chaperone HtpG [Candidatus Cloacimonadota bacterium]